MRMSCRRSQHGGCLIAVVAACCLAAGCVKLGVIDHVPLRLADDVKIPRRCAVVFFVDCMIATSVDELLAAGKLPNIRRYFADGGVKVKVASTVLPTITYPATASMLTGRMPGGHGVVGNQWFDRKECRYRSYVSPWTYDLVDGDYEVANVFEMLAEVGEDSAVITCPNRRGAKIVLANRISGAVCYAHGCYEQIDWISAVRVGEVGDIVNRQSRRWPQLLLVYLPGCDEIMHTAGPGSARYRRGLENVDRCIGAVCEALDRNGLLDRTYLSLISDHGGVRATKSFDLVAWLNKQGIRATAERTWPDWSDARRREAFRDIDAVVVPDAKRFATIHVIGRKGRDGWPNAGWAKLKDCPVALSVRQTAGNRWRLVGSEGEGRLKRRGDAGTVLARCRFSYELLRGVDPLRLGPASRRLMDGKLHDSRQWLLAAAEDGQPDRVCQIPQLFDHRRSGEIVLFAADGWDFQADKVGDHGGLTATEALVPMYFAGPGLPKGGSIPAARVIDLTPTLLGLLGHEKLLNSHKMDGTNLAKQLRAAEPT